MNQNSPTLEIIDSINLQENLSDTSSSYAKNIDEVLAPPQELAASEKKLLYEYFEEEILNVIIDCHEDDWDGYGSRGISEKSIAKARLFCNNLQVPEALSRPYIGIDVDGYVMLTWQHRKDILSIIIQPNDTAVFSLIMGIERLNGVLNFDPGTVPPIISDKLNSLHKKCLQS